MIKHPEMDLSVFLDLESEFCVGQKYFCHENENEKNYLNPQFALFSNTMGSIQESNRVMDKKRENRFFHVFLWFLTGTPVHLESDCTQFVVLF